MFRAAIKKAHWLVLTATAFSFLIIYAFLYIIGFGRMILTGITSDSIAWAVIGTVAWLASVVLGASCLGEVLGRVWRRYR